MDWVNQYLPFLHEKEVHNTGDEQKYSKNRVVLFEMFVFLYLIMQGIIRIIVIDYGT